MNIKSLLTVALAATIFAANAVERKYYDAVVFEAPYGNPKSITWIDSNGEEYLTVNFSEDGREITESSDITYLPDGLRATEEHSSLLSTVTTSYKYDNVPPNAVMTEKASGMSETRYYYPEAGSDPANMKNTIKTIVFTNSILGTFRATTEYSDYVNDRTGNWISRKSTVYDDTPSLEGDSNEAPTLTRRRIEYWDNSRFTANYDALDFFTSNTDYLPVYSWSAQLFGCIPFGSMSYVDLLNVLKAKGVKYEVGYNKSVSIPSQIKTFFVDKGKKSVTCQFSAQLNSDGYIFGSGLLEKKEAMLLRNEMLRIMDGCGVKMNKGDAKPYHWKELYWGKVDGNTIWISLDKIGSYLPWSIHVHVFAPCWK